VQWQNGHPQQTISDLDIYRAADLVIKSHGADAAMEAARMVDRMLELGDLEGRDLWRRIRCAIEVLQAPADGIRH
jgi:hypothetical protein